MVFAARELSNYYSEDSNQYSQMPNEAVLEDTLVILS